MPKLVITDSEGSRTLALEGETKAGRLAENEIQLKVPEASRHHCRFFLEQGSWYVEDMGSSNGTLVNGRKVSKFELQDGDLISVGAVTLRFLDSVATAEEKGESAAGWGDDEISLEEPEPVKAPPRAAAPAAAAVTDIADEEFEPAGVDRAHTRMVDTGSAFDDPTFSLHDVPEEKKSILPSVFAIVLLLALAGGAAWLYMNRGRLSGEQTGAGGKVKVQSNLIPSRFWSFEPHEPDGTDDQAGWHKDDAIDPSSTGEVQDPVASGDQAWSISRRATDKLTGATWVSLSGSSEVDLSITPGKVYRLQGMAAVDSAKAIPGIGVTWIEPQGEDVREVAREVVAGAPPPGKKFAELSGLVQAPEGATRARIGLVAAGTGDVTFDDIVFDSGTPVPGREADVRGFRAWLTPSGALRVFHFARPVSDGIGIWREVEGGLEPPSQVFVPKAGANDAIVGTLREGGGELSASLAAADASFRATWKIGATAGHALLIPLAGSSDEINVTLLEGDRARRMRAAFQKASASGVIVGGQGDRMRIKFKDGEDKAFTAGLDVVVSSGRAFLKVDRGDRSTVVLECELSFDAEMAQARTLLAKAEEARRGGRMGESMAAYEEVLAKFPFDENLEKQASTELERMLNDGRNHIKAVSARVDDAKFFRTARLEDELVALLETDVNHYAGTNLLAELVAKRDELKLERVRTASEKHEAEAKAAFFRAQDYVAGKQPRKELAIALLEMVTTRYPNTEWSEQARQLLEKLKSGAGGAESRGTESRGTESR
jgi:FHA domain